jgi:Cu-Zn family superoxide dismutase
MTKYAQTVLLAATTALIACKGGDDKVVADLLGLGGHAVTGKVTFSDAGGKVRLDGEISGLAPGPHGFHIHQWGDCSAPDGKSAGDHFNPGHAQHGAPGAAVHAGDLGNIEADAAGRARVSLVLEQFEMGTGDRGILGRSLIVHEKKDDLASQPAGDSGDRVACAVIHAEGEAAKPVLPGA